MKKLDDALSGVTLLGFGTSPIIYFVEAHPQYDALVTEIFQRITDGKLEGRTSAISLSEVLVHPLRRGDNKLAEQYRDLLLHSDNFGLVSVDPRIAEQAAELRARHNFRTPDALQIAAALSAGCEVLVTNDVALKRVTEIRVLVLGDLEV